MSILIKVALDAIFTKNLKIDNFRTKKMENSPWIRGATLWNNLEKDTQLIDEKEIFKTISKKRFIPKIR